MFGQLFRGGNSWRVQGKGTTSRHVSSIQYFQVNTSRNRQGSKQGRRCSRQWVITDLFNFFPQRSNYFLILSFLFSKGVYKGLLQALYLFSKYIIQVSYRYRGFRVILYTRQGGIEYRFNVIQCYRVSISDDNIQ